MNRWHKALSLLPVLVAATCFGQVGWQSTPVPSDPLELATGTIQMLTAPEDRAAVIKLLNSARNN